MKNKNYAKLKTFAQLENERILLNQQIEILHNNRKRLLWNVKRRAIELCKEHPDAMVNLFGNNSKAELFLNKRYANYFSDSCFYTIIEQIESQCTQ